MESLDISRSEGKVFFGQLLGMCDQLTFPLGQAGYPAYKVNAPKDFFLSHFFQYVPFGPVADVLPYLSRRAKENSAIMEGAKVRRK
jgi:proline dehydrogenase